MSYTPIPGLSKDDVFNNILKEKELIINIEKLEEEILIKRDIIKKYLGIISIDYITNAIVNSKLKNEYRTILITERMRHFEKYTEINGKIMIDVFSNYYNINRKLLLNEPLKYIKLVNFSEYNLTNDDENKSFLEIVQSNLPSNYHIKIIEVHNGIFNHDIEIMIFPITNDICICNLI